MGLFRWLFSKACRVVFNRVDVNKDGYLESLEIEVAILQLYNLFNKRLPGWQDPPTRETIQTALVEFDKDKNNRLDPAEFEEFARELMKSGPDMFFARVGKHAMVTAAVLPAAGEAVRRAGPLVGIPQLKHVPLAFLAPILGNIAGAIRGLIPIKSS